MKLEELQLEELGTIKKVIVTKDNTTMISGNEENPELKARIEEIKTRVASSTSDYDKKQFQERLGKLTNGVATIKVGATTESELKEITY